MRDDIRDKLVLAILLLVPQVGLMAKRLEPDDMPPIYITTLRLSWLGITFCIMLSLNVT